VTGVGDTSPMKGWSCDTFQNDPEFSKAEMQQMYAANDDVPFTAFKSDWMDKNTPSGAADNNAPQKAPFYWGIKDVQYNDGQQSRTWRKSMLEKVRKHTKVPTFMDPRNMRDLFTTPEFWFAQSGAGAKAHMDTHIQTTMSLQLASEKRWRLGFMPSRHLQHLSMLYTDGSVYKHGRGWVPTHDVLLKPGDALFVPPGFIHETNNKGGECAASVTYQFSFPMATGLYREFLKRVRRTPDIWEVWPLLKEWASIGRGDINGSPKAWFNSLDANKDGSLTGDEIKQSRAEFERSSAEDVIAFHDSNGDGVVSLAEFETQYNRWDMMERDALSRKQTPLRSIGLDFDAEELHYEMLEDLGQDRRYAAKLASFAKGRLAEEQRIAEEAAQSSSRVDL